MELAYGRQLGRKWRLNRARNDCHGWPKAAQEHWFAGRSVLAGMCMAGDKVALACSLLIPTPTFRNANCFQDPNHVLCLSFGRRQACKTIQGWCFKGLEMRQDVFSEANISGCPVPLPQNHFHFCSWKHTLYSLHLFCDCFHCLYSMCPMHAFCEPSVDPPGPLRKTLHQTQIPDRMQMF